MSSTTTAEQRAALIREMARDLNRTRSSSGSRRSQGTASPDTTTSSFDPENEALMSTRQLETTAQKLPELRESAQKYNRFSRAEPQSEPDYAINTSAIGRAFPDFTQGGTSSDDGSQSIEIGRGHKRASTGTIGKLGRSSTRSPNPATSAADDSFDFSAPPINDHRVTSTPPLNNPKTRKGFNAARPAQRQNSQLRNGSSLRNEINDASPPLAKTQDNGSGSSRQGSDHRQTVTDKHARVTDDKDMSLISEECPPTVDLTVRSSRFGGARNQKSLQGEALPAKFSSKQNFVQPLPQTSQTRAQGQNTQDLSTPNYGTQQSFMLPDLPNITELVSGVYEDGTPVFSRDSKSRVPRFASSSDAQQRQVSRPDLVQVDEIAVDDDEQAIYLSLKLLQDKVADLERNRAETEIFIQELQHKNRVLEGEKAQRRSWQRSDSAIGMTDGASDGGDELGGGQRKLLIEKNRLESSVRALQSQVQSTDRKAVVAETTLRNVTKERDSAVSQLGVAYFTIEQLKAENANLANENQALKTKLAAGKDVKENQVHHATLKHDEAPTHLERSPAKSFNAKLPLRNTDVGKATAGRTANAPQLSRFEQFQAKLAMRQAQGQDGLSSVARDSAGSARQDAAQMKNASRHSSNQKRNSYVEPHPTDLFPRDQQVQQPGHYQTSQSSEDSDREETHREDIAFEAPPSSRPQSGPTQASEHEDSARDLTYISFVDSDEVAEIRRVLEQERIERKKRQAAKRQVSKVDDKTSQTEATKTRQEKSDTGLPRKSSMKARTRNATDPVDITGRLFEQADNTHQSTKSNAEHNRRHSETSVPEKREQHRSRQVENMTSAFILPDITIRHPGAESQPIRQVSAGAQVVLDDLKFHSGQNCTVCHQTIRQGDHHQHHGEAKRTITIPRPVPVSQRMPEPDEYNEDPTIRPSQPPGLALATVMKGLEDELSHLKIQLSQYQDLYNGHDPALSKRQRKHCGKKIEGLLTAIDVKADQIYALYDVLEGQKQDGHDITEQEVEMTLQSIGVDAAEISLRGGEADEVPQGKSTERHPWDLESSDEEELPWEGFESTVGTSKTANGMQGQRRSLSA